jgi:hypothetical protein
MSPTALSSVLSRLSAAVAVRVRPRIRRDPEPFDNGKISADHALPKQAMERQADAFLT